MEIFKRLPICGKGRGQCISAPTCGYSTHSPWYISLLLNRKQFIKCTRNNLEATFFSNPPFYSHMPSIPEYNKTRRREYHYSTKKGYKCVTFDRKHTVCHFNNFKRKCISLALFNRFTYCTNNYKIKIAIIQYQQRVWIRKIHVSKVWNT